MRPEFSTVEQEAILETACHGCLQNITVHVCTGTAVAQTFSKHPSGEKTQKEFANFTCNKHYFAKRGENVSITCKSNKTIKKVQVTFCFHHNDSCPDKSNINTEAGIYAADHRRILLKNFTGNTSSVYLLIHAVQIFDHRKYKICLKSDHGQNCPKPFLNVTAPYTIDEVKQQNDTTIVCKASGGHPERQLYWFDQHGTNLTHSSKLEATKTEDGSFLLSSILQMKSGIGGISYCCCFSNATCSDTCPNDAHWRRMFIYHVLSKQSPLQTSVDDIIQMMQMMGENAGKPHYQNMDVGKEQIQQEAVSDRMLPDQTPVTAVLG
ncbi:hypothetical protein lerEdw1_017885 [Lerista edwardsae]|nr:hypothetical protein lerEdw1_017885 [Lerista edwardsae]